jgi:hypothetical protein
MADGEAKEIEANSMPVATISNPFSDEEEKANADYREVLRRAGKAMQSGHDGKAERKNTEHQEALLHDARPLAEAKIAKTLKHAVAEAKLQTDSSEEEIQTFARDFKRGVMLDLYENYVPRSPYKADLNLGFEEFAVAVCSEGRLSIDKRVDAAIRKYITSTDGRDPKAWKAVVKTKAKRPRKLKLELLNGHEKVTLQNAAYAMGVTLRHVERLVKRQSLEGVGEGHFRQVLTLSIRKYCGLKEIPT